MEHEREHPKVTKIPKFACEMLQNVENIGLKILQIFNIFVLRAKN